jgi:hypothetical protein
LHLFIFFYVNFISFNILLFINFKIILKKNKKKIT